MSCIISEKNHTHKAPDQSHRGLQCYPYRRISLIAMEASSCVPGMLAHLFMFRPFALLSTRRCSGTREGLSRQHRSKASVAPKGDAVELSPGRIGSRRTCRPWPPCIRAQPGIFRRGRWSRSATGANAKTPSRHSRSGSAQRSRAWEDCPRDPRTVQSQGVSPCLRRSSGFVYIRPRQRSLTMAQIGRPRSLL